jgi:hypothetical protein
MTLYSQEEEKFEHLCVDSNFPYLGQQQLSWNATDTKVNPKKVLELLPNNGGMGAKGPRYHSLLSHSVSCKRFPRKGCRDALLATGSNTLV